jgi:uncharacterized protein YktA (UPF0223 family)
MRTLNQSTVKYYTQNKFDLETLYKDYPTYKNIIGSNGQRKTFNNFDF